MTEKEYAALQLQVRALPRENKAALELVCEALRNYRTQYDRKPGGLVLPNLIDAYAAIKLCRDIETMMKARP